MNTTGESRAGVRQPRADHPGRERNQRPRMGPGQMAQHGTGVFAPESRGRAVLRQIQDPSLSSCPFGRITTRTVCSSVRRSRYKHACLT